MKRNVFAALAFLLFAGLTICQANTETRWDGASEIAFEGTSTLHAWAGKVAAKPFVAKVTMSPQGQPVHISSKVEVKSAAMDTAEPKRDVQMHKSMHVAEFPLITGTMDLDFSQMTSDKKDVPARLPFKLAILGKENAVDAAIKNWTMKGDTAAFDLDFSVSLKQYGIEVPSMLLVVKVGDIIHVHAKVKLVRAKS